MNLKEELKIFTDDENVDELLRIVCTSL